MKGWQKGAIIGALWGVLSIMYGFAMGLKYMDIGSPSSNEIFIYKTFAFPTSYIMKYAVNQGLQGNIRFIFPVIFGALTGGGIGYLYGMWKEK